MWQIKGTDIVDGRAMAYGYAFVILVGTSALKIGLEEGRLLIREAWDFMEEFFLGRKILCICR